MRVTMQSARTSQPEQTLLDLAEIDRELARQGTSRAAKGFVAAHENFVYLSQKARREEALAEQKRRFLAVVSDERPWEYIEAVYMTGTIEDVQSRVQARVDAGIEHLFLHTMTAELDQLDLFAEHLLEPFKAARVER